MSNKENEGADFVREMKYMFISLKTFSSQSHLIMISIFDIDRFVEKRIEFIPVGLIRPDEETGIARITVHNQQMKKFLFLFFPAFNFIHLTPWSTSRK